MSTTNKITDIHCPSCGAPASYDIRKGIYACQHCGGKVTVGQAQEEKRGFRSLQQTKMREMAPKYRLDRASCTGCGAEVVFEENEALASCAFCGRALVRKKFLHKKDLPEIVIPFRITEEEAQKLLLDWCEKNRGKKEAGLLKKKADSLKGFYLPYEFVRGPVSCSVRRFADGGTYACGGFIDEVFVNCSGQLDNLLLDGMEPFDLSALTEFDFGYVAGHKVKTDNISGKELEKRIREEVGESYAPAVRKVLETKAVHVDADVSSVVRMPALLPVYYLSDGQLMAAVNGQTGKVSVRAIEESHYYFLPWWLKSLLATLVISAAAFAGFSLFGMERGQSLLMTAVLAFFTLVVTLCAYSDTDRLSFRVESGRKIFTSGNEAFTRVGGKLTGTTPPERNITPPVFFMRLNGKREEVVLRFSSPLRIVGMILTALVVLFLPVLVALFMNGFQFSRLNLAGSAVWFCIFVPVIPIYLIKFGRIDMYDRPWIYVVSEDGTMKRYREKNSSGITWKSILRLLFVPPVCLAVWFGIACFCTMCYLTAFGFG
jgi:ribosomal protein L37AE/L43A